MPDPTNDAPILSNNATAQPVAPDVAPATGAPVLNDVVGPVTGPVQTAPPTPRGVAPGQPIPRMTFGEGVQRAIHGPTYGQDSAGNFVNTDPVRAPSPGGVLGNILMGAAVGAMHGLAAQTQPGQKGKGAAYSAGASAAERASQEQDERNRQIAEKNAENQRAQTESKLRANLIVAQTHDLIQKSQHEEAEFGPHLEGLGLENQEHQLQIQKYLDERRQVAANLQEVLNVRGIHPYATISQTPVDGKSIDQQAAPHAKSLAQGVSLPVQSGKVGAQNGASLFGQADLDQPVTGNANDPSTWITVPHYDGTRDNQGNLISNPSIIKPDGKITYGDVARSFMAADNQLDVLMKKDAAVMGAAQKRADLAKTQQEVDPLFKLENDPSTMAGEKGPAVLATANARLADPNTSTMDKVRWQRVQVQAKNAIKATDLQKANQKAQEQAVTQGDPDAAGKLLADGTLTLEELKSRQVTPQFITQTVNAAKKYDSTFNAPQVAADAKIAGSEANQQFFGNVDSLITRGGTLDQVSAAAKNLQNGKIPVFNSIANLTSAAAGKGPVAVYAAAILGVADDYSKVMGGSVGSDTARQQVLDRANAAQSPEQTDGVLNQFRQQIMSQRQGRIGTNTYLRNMHPVPDGALPSVQVTDPRGGIHTFSDQASADRFKQKAGIQ